MRRGAARGLTGRPRVLPAHPADDHHNGASTMKRDILSDVLRSLHLRGAVFYQLSLPDDWAVEAPPMHEVAGLLFPDAEHVMEYHVMAEGSGWASLAGQAPVRLGSGDVVILPHGDAHVLSSNPELRPTRIDPAWVLATRDAPKPIPIVSTARSNSPGACPMAAVAPTA